MHARLWMGLLLVGLGCSATGSSSSGSAGSTGGAGSVLPIGDGQWGTAAAVGRIYVCSTHFGGGGAFTDGPWIFTDGGFTEDAKVHVQGAVDWPAHRFEVSVSGSTRTLTGNNLPDHATGTFPVSSSDPAYAYDRNPNAIGAQTLSWAMPANPTVATAPTCLTGGAIGVLLTGVVFFDALDAEGRDAVAHESQDACDAHPEMSGAYHYHSTTPCQADPGTGHSNLLGYARDGFGIYGVRGEDGLPVHNADLDECHGHTHNVTWDGQTVSLYHYHATAEYPYTLGCFRGTPITGGL